MSEKLTEQKIDEMIQELLQERFPYKVDDNSIKKITPPGSVQPQKKRIRNIADLEPQDYELGQNDIEAGLLGGDDEIEKDIAKLATDSKSDDLRQDIADVIGRFGGELDTTTGRIKKITDDPEQIAGDIKMGGGVSAPSAAALTGKIRGKVPDIKAYQSTIEQLSIFRQLTGPAKFVEMERIAEAIAKRDFPTDTREMFEFITKANVLNYFGNLGKNFSALEAGLEFEKFCAILMNGLQVGGSGGAADVFLALKNGNVVPTSQKLYASYDAKQSNKGKGKGLYPLLKKHDELYYYVGIKTGTAGTAASYTTYDFYVIKITQDGDNFIGASLNSEGVYVDPKVLGPYQEEGETFIFGLDKKPYSNSLARIPFMIKADESASAIATYMNKQMTDGDTDFNKLSKSIYKVFGSLRKMGNDTQIYNAKKGKGKRQQGIASGYIKNIASNYIELKKDYNILFNIGEGPKKEKDYMVKTTESKIQSLDDLIAETIRDIKRKRKK